jgi:hypothetical protein
MDTLNPGEILKPGQGLKSNNGYHVLAMQEDGNLVLYSLGKPVWASFTDGQQVDRLIMQDDGNLVAYPKPDSAPGESVFTTNTFGNGPSRLVMQDDRNAVIYTLTDPPVATWNSQTATPPEQWEKVQFQAPAAFIEKAKADADVGALIGSDGIGLQCALTPTGIVVCVTALVVIGVLLEFANGDPPFGPGNDFRLIGGEISDATKHAGKVFSDWAKGRGEVISKTWKKWFH